MKYKAFIYIQSSAFLLAILFSGIHVNAQKSAKDSLLNGDSLNEYVVTATRSDRKLSDVPIPVNIIAQKQIESSGASRLDEILSEQTGLAIINNHGLGVQMQGMSPEYTLILINGEPVIGRTAGTLDLTRISLNDVKRIEIIKGPSSSLYGSDALAGVINIITRKGGSNVIGFHSKYGSNQTLDNTITGTATLGSKGVATLSANRYSTAGYDLMPNTYGKTVDPYTDYTFRGNLNYQLTPKLKATFNGHYFSETQRQNYLVNTIKDSIVVKGNGKVQDKRICPVLSYKFSPKWKLKLRSYWSQYKTQTDLYDSRIDTAYENEYFRQNIWKEELQSETILTQHQILTVGAGFTLQNLAATRYSSKKELSNYFLYAQHEWHPAAKWSILTGLRLDVPSAYHTQLSPKIAAQYKWNKHWKFQASVGSGYKVPDFRQMYLTFSNAIVGYSVLGNKAIQEGLAKMEAEGRIAKGTVDTTKINMDLRPESSIAYNLGATYSANAGWKIQANLFRNDIMDLIDNRIVAMKSNGLPLYSYYNIHRVFTEGVELDGSLPLFNRKLVVSAGYQFLIARDKDVVAEIENGKMYQRNPDVLLEGSIPLKMSDYGGLFNRSRHTFNLKVYYTHKSWAVNARVLYRGRFGFVDLDGNNIPNGKDEFAPGYVLCHLNVARTFWSNQLKIRAGVKDLFDYTDPQHLSFIPGRTWYVGLALHLHK